MKRLAGLGKFYLAAGFIFILNFSCKPSSKKLFSLVTDSGIDFINEVEDTQEENIVTFRNFYNGGGVAIGDLNNDGLADVVMTSNRGDNQIYLNKGLLKFENITTQSGFRQDHMWSTGVVLADVNGDGWLDVFICNSGHMGDGNRRNKLYINNHDLSFTESAAKYGLAISAYCTQASFFDYDGDGDLDCFMIDNSPIPVNQLNYSNRRDMPDSLLAIANNLKGGGDHLYRNDHGHFTEVTRQAGIHGGVISFGLGVSVSDVNNDGWPDIFVSNDSYERDYLYINQRNGTFKDELESWLQHTSFSSMGADIADINNDGFPDIFTTDMLPENMHRLRTMASFDSYSLFEAKIKAGLYYQYPKNCLQLNNENGRFTDIGRYSGVAASDWSWGALIFDMDNDGWNDLLVCNGINRDITNLDFMDFFANDVLWSMARTGKKYEMDKLIQTIPQARLQKKAYRNEHNLLFTDKAVEWGLAEPSSSNGAAYGDLDNDGDLDLIVNNENQICSVYKNNSRELTKNNYVSVRLLGQGKNPFALGSKVSLYAGGQTFTRELFPCRGFQSSVDYKLVFGLGNINKLDSMKVTWPDRSQSVLKKLLVNTDYKFEQSKINKHGLVRKDNGEDTYFKKLSSNFCKHEENAYSDFYSERGVPRMLSREGPKCALADVNGDGLQDIYIGGAKGHSGQLYLQAEDGSFHQKKEVAFEPFSTFEDVAVLFFDYNRDGYPDLLVCPGGNLFPQNPYEMQLRLFKNDGRGNFTLVEDAFPRTQMNVAVAISNDINQDGYPDLFIGSRNVSGHYGDDPQSFIFLNDAKGHFRDIAETKNIDIAHIGMVTGAVFADLIGDRQKELLIVGEWMPPRIFTWKGTRFSEVRTKLSSKSGWWQGVSVADIDGNGKEDLLLGNIGENFYLKPDSTHPAKLWLNDFDKNGVPDKIITSHEHGKDIPILLKHDMEDQLPAIKKNNLKHEIYADKGMEELFSKNLIESSRVKTFNYPSSCVALNMGRGQFKIIKLPFMSQLSCINNILPLDVDGDGRIDLVTGGNQFGFLPQLERLDGSFGDVLINKGGGQFIWQTPRKTGLDLRGEMRDMVSIKTRKSKEVLFLQNNAKPALYQMRLFNKFTKKE